MNRATVAALGVVVLAGCVAPRKVTPAIELWVAFDPEKHAAYEVPGPYSVSGEAFLRQRGGGVVTCAGSEVLVMPRTAFFDDYLRFHAAGGGDWQLVDPEKSALKLVHHAKCDSAGRFSVAGLPRGEWRIATTVQWMSGNFKQGGILSRVVAVGGPTPVAVMLTGDDLRY